MQNQVTQETFNQLKQQFSSCCLQIGQELTEAQRRIKKCEKQIKTTSKNKKESLEGIHPEQFSKFEEKLQKQQQKYFMISNRIEQLKKILDAFTNLFQQLQDLFDNIHTFALQIQPKFNISIVCFEKVINCLQNFEQEDLISLAYNFVDKCQTIISLLKVVVDFLVQQKVILEVKQFQELEQVLKTVMRKISQKKREFKKVKEEKIQELKDYQQKIQQNRKQKKRNNEYFRKENESKSSESENDDGQKDILFISDGHQNIESYNQPILKNSEQNEFADQKLIEAPYESVIIFQLNVQGVLNHEEQVESDSPKMSELNEKLNQLELNKQHRNKQKVEKHKKLDNAIQKMKEQIKTTMRKITVIAQDSSQEEIEEFQILQDKIRFEQKNRFKKNLQDDYKNFAHNEDKYQKKQQQIKKEKARKNQKQLREQNKLKVSLISDNLFQQSFENISEKVKMEKLNNNQYDNSINNTQDLQEDIINFQQDIQNLQETKKQRQKNISISKTQKEKEELTGFIIDYIQVQRQTLKKEVQQGINFEKMCETIIKKVYNDALACCNCFGIQCLYITPCCQRIFCQNCEQIIVNCCQICDKLSYNFHIVD